MIRFLIFCLCLSSSVFAFNLDSLLIKSLGGEKSFDKMSKITTSVTSGKIIMNGMEGRFKQIFMMPDKLYMEIDLSDFKLTQAYDGSTAWKTDLNGTPQKLSGFEARDIQNSVYFESLSYLGAGKLWGSKEYIGLFVSDSIQYHQVSFYPMDIDTVYAFFEEKTGLRMMVISELDNVKTYTHVDDYRLVDEMLFPFYSNIEVEGANSLTEFTIDSILINQPIDPAIFFMPSKGKDSYSFPIGQNSITIPFEYKNGHIRIPIDLNNKRKLWMILDSGASSSVYHKPSIIDLNLPLIGTIPAKGIGGYENADLIKVDKINIGDIQLYDKINGSIDIASLAYPGADNEKFGGILGYDFLKEFPVQINYDEKTVTIFNPDSFVAPNDGFEINFTYYMSIPAIDATLCGIKGKFIVDSGNSFGLVVHKKFIETNNLYDKFNNMESIPRGLGGIGSFAQGHSAETGPFTIGEITIDSLIVILPESSHGITGSREIAGNIGNLVLQNFKVIFDYGHQRLIFYPPN